MTSIKVGPATLDLTLYAGDGFSLAFQFTTAAVPPVPWPAEGAWTAQVRSPATSSLVLLDFTVDTSQQNDGLILIALTGEQVRSLIGIAGCVWDLQQQEVGAEPRTWYRGKVTVRQDVTRVGV